MAVGPDAARLAGGPPLPWRIACVNFRNDELDDMRAMLKALRPYLKVSWTVADKLPGEACIVNLDAGEQQLATGAASCTVGCSLRPRVHGAGTLHRPLRAAEVLSFLTDAGECLAGAPRTAVAGDLEWAYRLRRWPRGFEHWPKSWWRVLACISHHERTLGEVAARAGVPAETVEACLSALRGDSAIRRRARAAGVARGATDSTHRWRRLAGRVAAVFGFSP